MPNSIDNENNNNIAANCRHSLTAVLCSLIQLKNYHYKCSLFLLWHINRRSGGPIIHRLTFPIADIYFLTRVSVCRPVSWALCWRSRSDAARTCRASWAVRCWRWSAPRPTWRSCCSTTPGCSRTQRNTRPSKEPTTPCSTGQRPTGRHNRLIWMKSL